MARSLDRPAEPWVPPSEAPPVPWERVELTLRQANRWPSPHRLSPWSPTSPRRAAVAVVLWGDASGARRLLLVRRGDGAPHHPGEWAFPGGMVELADRDLPATARRELAEEVGLSEGLWELGCFPDGVAKGRTRFTPVFFRWEAADPHPEPGPELAEACLLPIVPLMDAPWTAETLTHHGMALRVPRLEMPGGALWGATAFILHAWLQTLTRVVSGGEAPRSPRP